MIPEDWLRFLATPLLVITTLADSRAELVTIEYEAEASTVVGQPFGLDVPRLTRVHGFFRYESSAVDLRPNDQRRGSFVLGPGAWEFEARFLGHTVRGSQQATASTETFGHTLRFNDGGDRKETGDMSFDGVFRIDIALGFSIVGNSSHLPTDQLPAPFTYQPGNPHTFVIDDDSGRMLLQFRTVNQVVVPLPPPEIKSIEIAPNQTEIATIRWSSVAGQSYQVEASSDFIEWTPVGDPVNATSEETSATASLGANDRFFYRVRRMTIP
jgi:hypothetical protein